MSLTRSGLRRAAAVGLVLTSALAAAPAAQAEARTLTANCRYQAGFLPLSLTAKIDYDVKTSFEIGERAPFLTVTAVKLTPGFTDIPLGPSKVSLSSALVQDGVSVRTRTNFNVPLAAPADGPEWFAEEPGEWQHVVQGLSLNVTLLDADGNPTQLPLGPGEEDADGNPDTTDFVCALPVGGTPPTVVVTDVSDLPPSKPGPITVVPGPGGTAKVTWGAAPDPDISGYRIYLNGTRVGSVSGTTTSFVLTGLASSTVYAVAVTAVDAEGAESLPERATFNAGIIIEDPGYAGDYLVSGNAAIKTLVRGTVGLSGGLRIQADSSGNVSGELGLNPASARLTALGFLPVTAKLAFASSGGLSGTYASSGALTANAKVRIKVTEAKLFGAIPLVAGNNCQTRQLTDLALTSADFGFDGDDTLTGKFAISDLNGCGVLNGLVSPATAGAGNTISLKTSLIPPPATS